MPKPKTTVALCTPNDAKPIRLKKQIGGWVEMEFDAKVVRHGVTWLHVKGGFGERGDREDWVCTLPGMTLSVSDYNWNRDKPFGVKLGKTFDEAVAQALKKKVGQQRRDVVEAREVLAEKEKGLALLEAAIKKATQ